MDSLALWLIEHERKMTDRSMDNIENIESSSRLHVDHRACSLVCSIITWQDIWPFFFFVTLFAFEREISSNLLIQRTTRCLLAYYARLAFVVLGCNYACSVGGDHGEVDSLYCSCNIFTGMLIMQETKI